MSEKVRMCKDCKRLFPASEISHHSLCSDCGHKRVIKSILQLREQKGVYYEKWLRNLRKAIGKEDEDDEEIDD